MDFHEKLGTLAKLFLLIGWMLNLIQILQTIDGGVTTIFIFRCAAFAFPAVGGILGYIPDWALTI